MKVQETRTIGKVWNAKHNGRNTVMAEVSNGSWVDIYVYVGKKLSDSQAAWLVEAATMKGEVDLAHWMLAEVHGEMEANGIF